MKVRSVDEIRFSSGPLVLLLGGCTLGEEGWRERERRREGIATPFCQSEDGISLSLPSPLKDITSDSERRIRCGRVGAGRSERNEEGGHETGRKGKTYILHTYM
jgi:hypothetical protein